MKKRKRMGEILVEAGVVREEDLRRALDAQKISGKRLGRVLEEMGIVTEKDIALVLARQFGLKPIWNISRYAFPPEVLSLIKGEEALKKGIFPLKRENRILYLAMVNPLDMTTLDELTFRTGLKVIPCVTTVSEIQQAVKKHFLAPKPAEREETEEKENWWTILVVDDQEMVRAAVAAALKRQGFIVHQAANGAEALKALHRNLPHLIILDIVMPRMDGYEMFRALKPDPRAGSIPVIALTAKSSPEEEAKLLEMGFFDFIPKPINPIRLSARVKRALLFVYGENPPPDAGDSPD